jgi:hypothetical protein
MEMFLLAFAMSLVGVVVCAALFSAAVRGEAREPVVAHRVPAAIAKPGRFFVDAATPPPVPIEALLLQIEQHVRLEQAAAEAFLHAPTRQSLYSRTMSPLVH